jgi:hypothetical protein
VVVAVLDTGGLYRKRHPDLTPNQLPGYDSFVCYLIWTLRM